MFAIFPRLSGPAWMAGGRRYNLQGMVFASALHQTKQIVGETRAKLIRDGGMSPDEFYTDKGEWLTLKQLRERDAQVFRKAGI